MDDQHHVGSGHQMLIIGADDGNLRLACEACGAHAIRPSSLLFWAARCQVCGQIAEIHGPRERITDRAAASRPGSRGPSVEPLPYGSFRP